MTMDVLGRSWGAMSRDFAEEYLRTRGSPAVSSKRLLAEVIGAWSRGRTVSVVDLGCGNAQLYEFFRASGLDCRYTGVDFSEPLLEAARETFAGDSNAQFVHADVNTLEGVTGEYDIALYSHVIEMLGSPEASLLAARRLAGCVMIRFFEPPDFETDTVEIRDMEVGEGHVVPYLRRKMGRDHYRMILAKMGCTKVDVYRDESSKDQVHVLHYPGT